MQRRDHQDGLIGNVETLLDSSDTDKQFLENTDNNASVYELYIIEYTDKKLFIVISCRII